MASIVLTPENPDHSPCYSGHKWHAVGRAQERIFAVGLYFYDVENIVWSRLMFRDPVAGKVFNDSHELRKFSSVLEDVNEDAHGCGYTQEVGNIEIKNGQYICYPNLYQTKTPGFQLADPTKPGHVKFIAFYIADPTTRLISTSVVSPQQPGWANAAEVDECDLASEEAEELKLAHANCNQHVGQRFNVRLTVRQE
ncbi:hypothetical protein GGI24_005382 [Coemansia furcata]|nr:hypothetical protein GGI24_005382 [Coemansia furcata]